EIVRPGRQPLPRLFLALVPQVVQRGDRLFMYGHQVIRAEEDIQFMAGEARCWAEAGSVQYDVEVLLPVIHAGDVGLVERIVQGQRVEGEVLAEEPGDLLHIGGVWNHVQPEGPALLCQGVLDLVHGEVVERLPYRRAEDGADHGGDQFGLKRRGTVAPEVPS